VSTSAKVLLKTVKKSPGQSLLAPPLAATIHACGWLADQFGLQDLVDKKHVDEKLGELDQLIEAIPPTIADDGLMCYLRNRVRSCGQLWAAGESGAAAYQCREMSRKLARLQTV